MNKDLRAKQFDVMIPVAGKDINFMPRVIKYCKRCFPELRKVYVVTPAYEVAKATKKTSHFTDVTVVNEDTLLEGLSFRTVANLIKKATTKRISTGWFFQQFLKYAFAHSPYADEYYLTWDADTLPLARIKFFKDEHPLFTIKTEYHENYFDTIRRVLGLEKRIKGSFVAEHMLFNVSLVKELTDAISQSEITGDTWYEKIINACNFDKDMQAFSEFETYGTFVTSRHADLYGHRTLCTFRQAGYIRGRKIPDWMLEEMSFDLDTASFELWNEPPFPYNLEYKYIRWQNKWHKLHTTPVSELPAILIHKIKNHFKKQTPSGLGRLPKGEETTN